MSAPSALNARQRRFVDEYLVDLNATGAAKRAGYSLKTAYAIGQENLKKPEIAAAIQSAMDDRASGTRVKAYRILEELATIALSSIEHFEIDENGNVTLADGAPADALRAVSRIKKKTRAIPQDDGDAIIEHETEIALWDKNSAIDKAMKHLGIISDKVDHTTGGKPIRFTLKIGEKGEKGAPDE